MYPQHPQPLYWAGGPLYHGLIEQTQESESE